MMRPYQAVVLTYWRRATHSLFSLFMVAIAIMGIVMLVILPSKGIISSAWAAFYAPGLVAFHLKQQMVHVRERRLPAARGPHIVIAVGLLLLVGVGVPVLRMAVTHQWCWGFPGLIFAASALVFVGMISGVWWLTFLLLGAIWVSLAPAVQEWLAQLTDGFHEDAGRALLAGGIAVISAAIVWLLRMTEENTRYYWYGNQSVRAESLYQRQSIDTVQGEAIKSYWKNPWFSPSEPTKADFERWKHWAHGSIWQRVNLWTAGRGISFKYWIYIFVFPLMMIAPQWIVKGQIHIEPVLPVFFVIMPSMMIFGMWIQARPAWGMELLRPVSRSRYVLEMGLTLAKLVAVGWLIVMGGWFFAVAMFQSDVFQRMQLLRLLAPAAVIQFLLLSIGLWTIRFQSRAAWMAVFVGTMPAAMLLSTTLTMYQPVSNNPLMFGIFMGILILASILIAWDAYRRWLNTEFG